MGRPFLFSAQILQRNSEPGMGVGQVGIEAHSRLKAGDGLLQLLLVAKHAPQVFVDDGVIGLGAARRSGSKQPLRPICQASARSNPRLLCDSTKPGLMRMACW